MLVPPLQLIDNFLLNFNVGQILLLVFILSTLAALTQKSQKIMGIQWAVFGLIFLLTPQSLEPMEYKLLGVALLFIGPMLYVTGRR